MKTLKLRNHFQTDSTLVDNSFIDNHMATANGEYVKVYLFLLRHLSNPSMPLTITTIADCLENTEKDILRALKHWQKEGLIAIEYDSLGGISGIDIGTGLNEKTSNTEIPNVQRLNTVSTAEPPAAPSNIEPFQNHKELKSLLFIAEQYLGKTLSGKDIETITYFYDTLHFSADLVEYLIEYCVENGHKSMHYIQKVALSWADSNITTVDQAKQNSVFYNDYVKIGYSVLKAFGIRGRAPVASELVYITKWSEEYGFSLDLIGEACNRTMAKLHQPNFEYTDSILKKWLSSNVVHLSDLEHLDRSHRQAAASRKTETNTMKKNKFNNFEGHNYDLASLEKQLLSR